MSTAPSRPRPAPWIYPALAAAGLLGPWYFNLLFFQSGGTLAPGSFFGSALANALTTAITLDVYLAALTFSVWVVRDASHSRVARPWLYIAACFGLGLSFALPLYLVMRERALR